jgi:endogenous inhibitor of DNA gyrase (YacG/DUF329 family)
MALKYDGFYYYMYNNTMSKECIKFYRFGIVKRILWDNSISNDVESKFFDDDCMTASIVDNQNYSFRLKLENNDVMFYEYKNSDNDKLYFHIKYTNGFFEEREYKYYKASNYSKNTKNDEASKKEIEFSCIACGNKFIIFSKEKYDAFVCKECRSVYTYEWISNKLQINIIKKTKNIPPDIKRLFDFFQLTENEISLNNIKSKYRELLSQYHPDKVSNLGNEIKDLAERKTKEIIDSYERLNEWVKNNIQ